VKARKVKGLDPQRSLGENAARIVIVRLRELRGFAPKALHPGASRAQHDMRIAAKRLRYALETTGFCFGKPAQAAARRARDLQDLLGELHDCDVMLPRIESHLAELRSADAQQVRDKADDAPDLDPRLAARARHRTAYRGLEVLAVYLEARRKLLFDRFRVFWERQEQTGTWERLERAVTRTLREARERRERAELLERTRRELEKAERDQREAAERVRRSTAALAAAHEEQNSGSNAAALQAPPGADSQV
jgi:CHAD domain